jgi:mannose-1-phosphate guanylyltransferase
VTIGIAPTAPEVGYGYLEVGAARDDGTREVTRFVEKPDAATAVKYVASGYLWNGGMFIVRAQRLLDEIERHMPDTFAGLQARTDDAYLAVPSISIDYGVMERATGVVTVPGDFGWHDVGSWGALAAYRHADENGNVCDGDAVLVDAKRNITVTDDGVIALIGVEDLVVVRSGNAVLVAPRDRAQDVRAVVAELQRRGRDDYL